MAEPSIPRDVQAELDRLRVMLDVSDAVADDAAGICKMALAARLASMESAVLAASALYAACRYTETPRTLKDIGQASNIKRKDIARCYRLLLGELNLKMPAVDPIKCISRIASRAGLSEDTEKKAAGILSTAEAHGVRGGKDPVGLAAAALSGAHLQRRGPGHVGYGSCGQRDKSHHTKHVQGLENGAGFLGLEQPQVRAPSGTKDWLDA